MIQYNTTTLDNGLRIVHLPVESDVVYCGYALAAGARHETNDQFGLAHFCEHMTFKGTANRTPLQVINTLERVGGDLNAFTTKQDTFYYATILREYLPRAVDLLTDIVFNSTYPQHEIEHEVEVVCDEIESYNDTPADLIYDEFENIIFEGTPLGHNILGETERVRRFLTADCQLFTQTHYKPSRAVFYVLGKVDFSKLVALLAKKHSKIHTLDAVIEEKSIGSWPELGGKVITKTIDSHQTHVMVGTRLPLDCRFEMFLLNNILGGPSMNSRLNLSLREKRGLVYSVDSSMTTYKDTLLWSVYFGSDPGDYKRCLRLIHSELARLQRTRLSATALRQAKQQLKGQLAIASENRENFAIDMAKQFLHRGTLRQPEALSERIDAVTSESLQRLATEFLTPEKLTTLVMC